MSKNVTLGLLTTDEYLMLIKATQKMQNDRRYLDTKVSYRSFVIKACRDYLDGSIEL